MATVPEGAERAIKVACPGLKVEPWEPSDAPHLDMYWGPWRECHTGNAVDTHVRHICSSGGAISALAIFALQKGLVEQVVHVAADPDRPTANRTIISRTKDEVLSGAGSRYAPSSPLTDLDELLATGSKSLFIGKPCDVSALRSYAAVDPRVDQTFPYKLSFFCGGVPSLHGSDQITLSLGCDPHEVANFTYRGEGWPGRTQVSDSAGEKAEMSYEESWGRHLSSKVQFRCKICPDPVGGVADIACADAWYGGESGYPKFEEADGRSLVLVRTGAGAELLDMAVREGAIELQDLALREIDLMQPAQARRKRLIAARMAAWNFAGRPTPEMRGLKVGRAMRNSPRLALLKEFAGTLRRIVQGRI
jgi:coenzyme F420 hydrogenase subunit beta